MEHTPERRIIDARAPYLDYEDEPDLSKPDRRGNLVLWAMFLVGVSMFLWALFGHLTEAEAHEAPLGWKYPLICCSNKDCRPAAEQEVRETPEGYQIASTGEVVPYGNKRIKDSPDGMYHVCQQGGNFDTGRVLCLFVPPRAF